MCYGCFEKYKDTVEITQRAKDAAEIIPVIYADCPAGGDLHIVIDDWNIEDRHVDFCMKELETSEYHQDIVDAERKFLELFKAMSENERAGCLALADGFIEHKQQ